MVVYDSDASTTHHLTALLKLLSNFIHDLNLKEITKKYITSYMDHHSAKDLSIVFYRYVGVDITLFCAYRYT